MFFFADTPNLYASACPTLRKALLRARVLVSCWALRPGNFPGVTLGVAPIAHHAKFSGGYLKKGFRWPSLADSGHHSRT